MEKLLSDLLIDRITSVTTVYNEAGATAKRTCRERWAIVVKYEGASVYLQNGRTVLSDATHLAVLPRSSTYEWRCIAAGHYTCIEFESEMCRADILSVPVSSADDILRIMKTLEYKSLQKRPSYRMESLRDTYTVLLKLSEAVCEKYVPGEKVEKLAPAYEYMLCHYTEPLTNDSLAALCGLSTVYFRKLFRDAYGTSPIGYVHALRIKKAKEMLRGDHGSITALATTLGYASIYDFSRDFKKRVGLPPSEFV